LAESTQFPSLIKDACNGGNNGQTMLPEHVRLLIILYYARRLPATAEVASPLQKRPKLFFAAHSSPSTTTTGRELGVYHLPLDKPNSQETIACF
jgi:hypothetical protein